MFDMNFASLVINQNIVQITLYKIVDVISQNIVYVMLIINKIVDKIEKQNFVFVKVQKNNKRNKVFVIWIHAKFVENDYDVQFDEIFEINNFNQRFLDQKYKISIAFDNSIELSIIDAKSKIVVKLRDE